MNKTCKNLKQWS